MPIAILDAALAEASDAAGFVRQLLVFGNVMCQTGNKGWQMETVLDRFGRIVVPKEAREKLALEPGSRLEVVVTGDTIILRRPSEAQPLHVRDGVLVYGGEVVGDLTSGIAADRQARIERVRGRRGK